MSVIMIAEVAGADATFFDAMRNAGLVDQLQAYPGFVSHASGEASSGYRVFEVWDSREAHQDWVEKVVLPSMPPGAPAPTWEYIELNASASAT